MATTTSNSGFTVRRLLAAISERLEEARRVDLGYPLGNNCVNAPTSTPLKGLIPPAHPNYGAVTAFYELCDGISLPDVGNGVFIHSRNLIETNQQRGMPSTLREGGPVVIFGSDGGGGLFAMPAATSEILYLPVGAVTHGEFNNARYPTRSVSSTFTDFLARVLQDIEAFIDRRPSWRFLGS